ncbi:exosome complex component RRP42-like isoform X2 [Pyrus x bretschneideri]|uniref:exosome complex component RRP42-like isoform X2 n=1 Tax=Pyrus x bretschneideri TaxID=225117 RepID=UPI00202E7265|nr:exosome complex component RRP42-like isoform X2 [Pyrus x bretschneideri]
MGEHSLHYRLEDAVPASSLSLCISSRPQRRRRRLSLIRASSSSSLLEMVGLSIGEKYFIQGGIAQDIRSNGRKRLTPRPINVKTGVISQANGSARVRMGATDVIASVKAELGRPTALQPDKGKVFINVDCSPTAAPMFEGRGGEELSAELSVALRCCLLGGKSGSGAGIDLSSLVVVEGKICWDLYIDGLVVSSDGNLLDALGAAIKEKKLMFPKAALSETGIPRVNVAAGASGSKANSF